MAYWESETLTLQKNEKFCEKIKFKYAPYYCNEDKNSTQYQTSSTF